ncbi:hypothetical protein TcWFU_009710 [Taenia crassiceps]|uniref:Uncharacterized protein n=1 Tax=Taenia crassiceps TaxID=6207 RepID=A0ABR4Q2A4_9CEST
MSEASGQPVCGPKMPFNLCLVLLTTSILLPGTALAIGKLAKPLVFTVLDPELTVPQNTEKEKKKGEKEEEEKDKKRLFSTSVLLCLLQSSLRTDLCRLLPLLQTSSLA